MDNKKVNVKELLKKATAALKARDEEIGKLKTKISSKEALKTKFAGLKGKKRAEVVEEIVKEVEAKLTQENVPPEAVEQAKEIVEIAVSEAEMQSEEGTGEEVSDIIDKDTQDELSEIAVSEDIEDEEVKAAAMKLLKCKDKKAMGREIVRFLKKTAERDNFIVGGSVGAQSSANGPKVKQSQACKDLEDFALGK